MSNSFGVWNYSQLLDSLPISPVSSGVMSQIGHLPPLLENLTLWRRRLEVDERLADVHQAMRVVDVNGLPIGYVREVSGRSVLVKELYGNRVVWISADVVASVSRDEVRLVTAHSVIPRSPESALR